MADCDGVIFMGACIYDLISYTSRFPMPGETIIGSSFQQSSGGKASNACVAAAKLGLYKPLLIAKIGDDFYGKEILNNFATFNVSSECILLSQESHTSVSTIWVTEKGENSIVYVPGAANLLSSSDVQLSKAHILASKLLVSTFECKPDTLYTALHLAKQHQVKTFLNAAPPYPGKFDRTLLNLCDYLCVNETEAGWLTGRSIETLQDAKEAVKDLLNEGCGTAIITLGEKGALIGENGSEEKVEHVPTKAGEPAVDTTGAGDAFVGALAYFLVRHQDLPLREKVKRACHFASISVTKKGVQTSYASRDELPDHYFS